MFYWKEYADIYANKELTSCIIKISQNVKTKSA